MIFKCDLVNYFSLISQIFFVSHLFSDKTIDLAKTNLKKLKVKDLKKILSQWGEDQACKGCAEKSDFIKVIEELMPVYAPEAYASRQKAEL